MGAVGMPVWLWTVTVRGYLITVTATPSRVDWDMGDGVGVTCTTAGTPYDPSYGLAPSPDCGHIYQVISASRPGQAHPVTATMTWQVTWSGDATGTTVTTTTDSTQIRIGEYQTVITN